MHVDVCDEGVCLCGAVECPDPDACNLGTCDRSSGCGTEPVVCDDENLCTTDSSDAEEGCQFVPVACAPGESCEEATGECLVVPQEITLQTELDGYAGVEDTFVRESEADAAFGDELVVEWDSKDPWNSDTMNYGLLRFGGIFESEGGQVPDGAEIVAAEVRYTVGNTGVAADLYESMSDWDEATTVNTYGDVPGIDPEDLGVLVGVAPGGSGEQFVDVTSSVEAWALDPTLNRGWIFVPSGADGVEFTSSEGTAAESPSLWIAYRTSDECTQDFDCEPAADLCTNNICLGGVCAAQEVSCNDENVCTDDACDPVIGCLNTNNESACDDGDACTTDQTCSDGICGSGIPVTCDDSIACTVDSCSADGSCTHVPDVSSCDDENVCTDDSCDLQQGCLHTPNTAACDDGDACTEEDACVQGACVGGSLVSCDDSNACTDDVCDSVVGCGSVDNTAACDDGNACTTGDLCGGGECQPGGPLSCDDGNVCTDDSCDPSSGCVVDNNTSACDDGDACTAETCSPDEGCLSEPVEGACDDGDACTVNDECSSGNCAGTPLDCSVQATECVAAYCDQVAGGCVTEPVDLGTPCSGGYCMGSQCVQVACAVRSPGVPVRPWALFTMAALVGVAAARRQRNG